MSPFGLKFSQMILHTETSKLMYNWSFLFEVLHKPTLLPSTFKLSGFKSYKAFGTNLLKIVHKETCHIFSMTKSSTEFCSKIVWTRSAFLNHMADKFNFLSFRRKESQN